jgi:pimeloyl-ACP methyl ester carboxylesterase
VRHERLLCTLALFSIQELQALVFLENGVEPLLRIKHSGGRQAVRLLCDQFAEPFAQDARLLRRLIQLRAVERRPDRPFVRGVDKRCAVHPRDQAFSIPDPFRRDAAKGWTLDSALLQRPGNAEIQLDLFGDYKTNVALYPSFHDYFRKHQPPLLAVWGKDDPFFLPAGAEAYLRDLPKSEIEFYDTGHFALETNVSEIGARIHAFLDREVKG